MKLEDIERQRKIVIERTKLLYREPDILAHYCDPDRDFAGGEKPHARSMAEKYVRRCGHILVVGCAGGLEAFWFTEDGFTVTGVDIVPELIEAARGHAKRKGYENRVRFELVGGFQWPVEDETCDGVCMMQNLLMHLPSRDIRKAVFTECFRVLGSGGVAMMQAPDRTHPGPNLTRPEWEPDNPEDFEKKAEWGLQDEPGVSVDRKHVCKGDANAKTLYPRFEADPNELREEVESCGFRVLRVQCDEDHKTRWPTVIVVARKD